MDVFIARQPIFDKNEKLYAYELLYRDGAKGNFAQVTDGSFATSSLVSDALTVFGMSTLTDSKPAFINFTKQLVMEDFALVLQPQEVVIELLEDIQVDAALVTKVQYLKKKGYTIALDDYVGDESFDILLPLADIIKVDFQLLTEEERKAIPLRLKSRKVKLLAEKVESYAEFKNAVSYGYSLFQGYFFARPKMLSKKSANVSASTCVKILNELSETEPRIDRVAKLVQSDAVLTYKLFQMMSTLKYYRGFAINTVMNALVRLGFSETRRWTVLMMAKENNNGKSDELIKIAYIRGIFMQRLTEISGSPSRSDDAFLLGMFSFMDVIMETPMEDILKDLTLPRDIVAALLNTQDNVLKRILDFVKQYECCSRSDAVATMDNLELDMEEILSLYIECLFEADSLFKELV
ncbi:MAG: EAL domain-containing protein [Oscillospiraceae bacterium]